MKYKRNDEALREALQTYTPEGMEVIVPFFGEATIVRAIPTNPLRRTIDESFTSPWMSYLVRAKNPVPFQEWVSLRFRGRQRADVQMSLNEWKAAATGRDRDILPMPDYLRERLEQGGTLSWADVELDDLQGRDCLDSRNNVTCYTFWSKDVKIQPEQLRVGMMVEHHWRQEVSKGSFEDLSVQGAIIQVDPARNLVLLELFTPTPYLLIPNAVDNDKIQAAFHSEGTYAIGYGTHEAFEIAEEESGEKLLPEGKWDSDKSIYTLKDFMPLSIIEDLCKAGSRESWCFLQALILYVVPMFLKHEEEEYQGIWRPLVKNDVPPDAIISYDFEA